MTGSGTNGLLAFGALTTWLVASVAGPRIFRDQLSQAGLGHTATEAQHVEEAFASALLVSNAFALLTSVLAALAVSWYFSRRVQRSISIVADAASQIAAGRHGARVPDPDPGLGLGLGAGSTCTVRLPTAQPVASSPPWQGAIRAVTAVDSRAGPCDRGGERGPAANLQRVTS